MKYFLKIFLLLLVFLSFANYALADKQKFVYDAGNGFYYLYYGGNMYGYNTPFNKVYAKDAESMCLYGYYTEYTNQATNEKYTYDATFYSDAPREISDYLITKGCIQVMVYKLVDSQKDVQKNDCKTGGFFDCIINKFSNKFPFGFIGNIPKSDALKCPKIILFERSFDLCFIYELFKLIKYPIIISLVIKLLLSL